jgi:ribosome maturation factor RimP
MGAHGEMKIDENVKRQLAALVADEGLELLATELAGSGSGAVVRLVVDGPDGVTLDQCTAVSRQASAMLDVEDPIGHAYTLEVSSPGLDRKLYTRDDYTRFAGEQVKIRMRPSYREHRVVAGRLVGLFDEQVHLTLDSNEDVRLPYDEVFETRLEVDWNAIMKEGKTRS